MSSLQRFLVYAMVGAAGTGVQYAVLVSLVFAIDADRVAASTAGAILGAVVNYLLNYRITFASRKNHRDALPKFLAVAGTGLVVNAAVMHFGVVVLQVHYLAAQVSSTLLVLVWGYAANRLWTFDETRHAGP